MTWFDLVSILNEIIPPLLVFLTAYFLIRSFLKNDAKRRETEADLRHKEKLIELKIESQKEIANVRLQAYERLMLFLERNRIPSLFLRLRKSNMNALALQSAMVRSIREEFEHNQSQQLYVSTEAWADFVKAKDATIDLIANDGPIEGEDSMSYGSRMIDAYAKHLMGKYDAAAQHLVKEVEKVFF